jgi:uncharacterized membrane protein
VFVASEKETEINEKLNSRDDPMIAVFMPCTPNPTTGFLMYVRKSEIVELDMTIEEAAKLVISAGLVVPEYQVPGAAEPMSVPLPATLAMAAPQPARKRRTASSRPKR